MSDFLNAILKGIDSLDSGSDNELDDFRGHKKEIKSTDETREILNKSLRIINEEKEQKNEQRKEYANKFITIAVCWLIFIGIIIVANGIHFWFSVDNIIILALLGTSLVNILAPAVLLAKYLFKDE